MNHTTATMELPLNYRSGSQADRQALHELALLSFSSHKARLSPDNWAALQANISNEERFTALLNMSRILVCCHNNKIVGAAYLIPSGNPTEVFDKEWCYIRMVGVHPDFRGRGIGRTLTTQCLILAKQSGEKTIALHTSEIMNDARHIYESMGFKMVRDIGMTYGITYWLFTLNLDEFQSL